jgi:hypothetical protein
MWSPEVETSQKMSHSSIFKSEKNQLVKDNKGKKAPLGTFSPVPNGQGNVPEATIQRLSSNEALVPQAEPVPSRRIITADRERGRLVADRSEFRVSRDVQYRRMGE